MAALHWLPVKSVASVLRREREREEKKEREEEKKKINVAKAAVIHSERFQARNRQ